MTTRLLDEIKQTRPFSGPEQEAYLSLGRTWAVLEHALAEALKPHGITPTQYNVLRILRGAGEKGLCRSEVMERMIARVPDATRLLDRMEAVGLIARERDAQDRRFVTTRITAEGRRVLAELEEPIQSLHRRQFAALDEADVRRLIELLGVVRENV
ncbi:MAG TPA: MarR family transcriptional regulator [Longimicrobiaceae bacterium]